MSGDDRTKDLSDEAKRTTQPTITAVFELVREVKRSVDATNDRLDATNARLDGTNARLDDLESGHSRDFASLDARLVELSEVVKSGFQRLEDKIDRGSLHSDAEYHDLRRRMRDLESKVS